MLYINFIKKLKTLNPRVTVIGSETNWPLGIYVKSHDGMTAPKHICGINRGIVSVPELTRRRWDGYVLLQGWRRVLIMLVDKKVIKLVEAEKLFNTNLRGRRTRLVIEKDPITKAMEEAKSRGLVKTGVENYVEIDDLVDIHRWREKLRQDKTNYWA